MGFFDQGKDVDYIPPTRVKGTEGTAGRDFLNNLMSGVKDFKAPTQQIAGMTDTEKQGQNILASILNGGAFRDPNESQYYAGLREASYADEDRAASKLRNRQNMTGMYNSGRAINEEGQLRSEFANNRNTVLGSLYNQENARDNPYTRMAAVSQYGGLPRQLQQGQNDADYQSVLYNMLFPYTTGSGLAQQIIGNEQWYNPTVTSTMSGFDKLSAGMQLGGQVAGAFMGMPTGAGGSAGGSGLGSSVNSMSPGPINQNAYWGPGSQNYINTGF